MRFDHPRNVHIGAGRIIFDQERGGWVLPGALHARPGRGPATPRPPSTCCSRAPTVSGPRPRPHTWPIVIGRSCQIPDARRTRSCAQPRSPSYAPTAWMVPRPGVGRDRRHRPCCPTGTPSTTPHVGGYYVLYEDGYESFSPAKAFEEGYTRFDGSEAKTVDHLIEAKIKGTPAADTRPSDAHQPRQDPAEQVGRFVQHLRQADSLDQRWVSIGATDLQTGFMALTRAIAQPTTFWSHDRPAQVRVRPQPETSGGLPPAGLPALRPARRHRLCRAQQLGRARQGAAASRPATSMWPPCATTATPSSTRAARWTMTSAGSSGGCPTS